MGQKGQNLAGRGSSRGFVRSVPFVPCPKANSGHLWSGLVSAPARTRPRGFAPWTPRPESLELVEAVRGVLSEYAAFLPLTIRQVFYRLVGTVGYPKDENAYARLCETMNRARRAGVLPFDAIRDDGVSRHDVQYWGGVEGFKASVARTAQAFRLDRQEGQASRLLLLCEAGGMAPMLAQVANRYGVPVLSSGGFDSTTAKHDLAHDLAATDGAAEVLHVGDLDPSGEHVFTSLAEDVGAMCEALCGAWPTFTRLAVTEAQAAAMALPSVPPKRTDRRSFSGTATVQAEAIPPDVLSRIVRDAIEARQDAEIRLAVLHREAMERAELAAWAAQ